ncbi:MAG: B12-binding domain-containing radical SAM protein [Anaerolineales bacterium]|nr:B12-binding domain-containing radical SAM protein [Anaerolineales bacterium]
MASIVFVNSPTQLYSESGRIEKYTTIPPYGLAYVATVAIEVLGKDQVKLIDGEHLGLSPENLASMLLVTSADYIGMNVTSPNFHIVKQVIKLVGGKLSDQRIFLGGPHAILSPEEILADREIRDHILFVCTGEGEEPIRMFLSGVPLSQIPGIAYNSGSEIVVKPRHITPQNDIDNLIVDRGLFANEPNVWQDGHTVEAHLVSSRGCPYTCAFCAAPEMVERKVRIRSAKALQTEIECLLKEGVNYIRFIDDLLIISKKRIRELYSIFTMLGINRSNFGFEANARSNIMARLTSEYWDMLFEMGLSEIELGIESGSLRILQSMLKYSTPTDVICTVDKAIKYGVKIKGFLMVGYLGETLEDVKLTVNLARTLKQMAGSKIRFSPVPVKAYPGTLLYQQVEALRRKKQICFGDSISVDLSEKLGSALHPSQVAIVKSRTRYNAMHTVQGNPIAISELSSGINTETAFRALSDLILISDNSPSNLLELGQNHIYGRS